MIPNRRMIGILIKIKSTKIRTKLNIEIRTINKTNATLKTKLLIIIEIMT